MVSAEGPDTAVNRYPAFETERIIHSEFPLEDAPVCSASSARVMEEAGVSYEGPYKDMKMYAILRGGYARTRRRRG